MKDKKTCCNLCSQLTLVWQIIWRSLLVFLLLCTTIEIGARIFFANNPGYGRALGFSYIMIEIKWFQLQEFVAENQGVDMIILGSSYANAGIDPAVIEKIIFERTGTNLRIYNFGLNGLTMSAILDMGRVLVDEYHPRMVLLVSELRDFDTENEIARISDIQNTPWMAFRSGHFNIMGFLINHSVALQLFMPYRNWMTPTFSSQFSEFNYRADLLLPNGYTVVNATNGISERTLNPLRPDEKYLLSMFQRQIIDTYRVQELSDFLHDMESANVHVILAEWPFSENIFESQGGQVSFALYQNTLGNLTIATNSNVLNSFPVEEDSVNSRFDRYHFNSTGAETYSQYLGSQISEMDWFRDLWRMDQ